MNNKKADKTEKIFRRFAELPPEVSALLTRKQKADIACAAKSGTPILVTGPQGPAGKTTLTKALREAGINAYEPHEMHVVELASFLF